MGVQIDTGDPHGLESPDASDPALNSFILDAPDASPRDPASSAHGRVTPRTYLLLPLHGAARRRQIHESQRAKPGETSENPRSCATLPGTPPKSAARPFPYGISLYFHICLPTFPHLRHVPLPPRPHRCLRQGRRRCRCLLCAALHRRALRRPHPRPRRLRHRGRRGRPHLPFPRRVPPVPLSHPRSTHFPPRLSTLVRFLRPIPVLRSHSLGTGPLPRRTPHPPRVRAVPSQRAPRYPRPQGPLEGARFPIIPRGHWRSATLDGARVTAIIFP